MRVLFKDCHLIHADLSEYNLLYWKGVIYFIDVSQSLEHDHPSAIEFLKRDICNVNDYFQKNGVDIWTLFNTYNFITDDSKENHEIIFKVYEEK